MLAASSGAADFKQVFRNPRAYHDQVVTLTGVARIQGLSFDLYENAADANNFSAVDRALSVSPRVNAPRYDAFDNRWVTITGIVDANRHGRIGSPCVILLESLKPLPVPAAGNRHVVVEVVVKNEDSKPVDIVLLNEAGQMYAEFSVLAHKTNGTGIRKGTLEVRQSSGKVITRSNLLLSSHESRYLDTASHIYYYHIVNGRFEGVRPEVAKSWRE